MAWEFLLIDLSAIAHPIWHMSQSEPDANATSIRTVSKVRSLAADHPRAAVCADSGRSFRRDVDPEYKANRPESDAALHHQIDLAIETLRGDGFPVWAAKGFEADDLIATACAKALEVGTPDSTVLIASADKDLLALVSPRVRAKSTNNGSILDEAAVFEKFSVKPCQMRDYLALVGDSSDNIKGAKGIGPKKAADLLHTFVELDIVYASIDDGTAKFSASTLASLEELRPRLKTVRELVSMRTDAPIPFEEILADRVPKDAATLLEGESMGEGGETIDEAAQQFAAETAPAVPASGPIPISAPAVPPIGPDVPMEIPAKSATPGTAMVTREDALAPPPAEWERQLDPRSNREARILAEDMFKSRLFSAYGTPHGVLSTILVGRELGLPAMAALRSVHIVEGRHTLSAALMVALVLKSGLAEYFDPVDFDAKQATFETKRKGGRKAITMTHTIEMAITAGLVKEKSNWMKTPVDMLCARAQSRLARMVYPDLLAGLYTPDELEEMKG